MIPLHKYEYTLLTIGDIIIMIILPSPFFSSGNRASNFMAAAQQEKRREREALESGLMFSRDRLTEATVVGLANRLVVLVSLLQCCYGKDRLCN